MKNLILSAIIILFSFNLEAQIEFKSKKLTDKMSGKLVDKTAQVVGIDYNNRLSEYLTQNNVGWRLR